MYKPPTPKAWNIGKTSPLRSTQSKNQHCTPADIHQEQKRAIMSKVGFDASRTVERALSLRIWKVKKKNAHERMNIATKSFDALNKGSGIERDWAIFWRLSIRRKRRDSFSISHPLACVEKSQRDVSNRDGTATQPVPHHRHRGPALRRRRRWGREFRHPGSLAGRRSLGPAFYSYRKCPDMNFCA